MIACSLAELRRRAAALGIAGMLLCPGALRADEAAVRPAAAPPSAPAAAQAPRADAPLTLAESYALALKRSETIAIQSELIRETEGRFLQAFSTALPDVTFSSSDTRQDGSGGSAFTLRNQHERKFTFSQPLFSGFKEFAAIAGSRAERRQREQERARAEQLLFVDVADAFYLLLQQWEDLAALETTRLTLTQRLDDLKEREQLGRSRASDVVSAEAQLRRVEADIQTSRRQDELTRNLLEFLTGLEQIAGLTDTDAALPRLEHEGTYLTRVSERADVRAAQDAWEAAKKEVAIARSDFFPDVTADANYYVDRTGVAQDIQWDATLTVDVPLFQGGQVVGAVRETSSKARQAKLRYEQTRRRAELDVRDAHARLRSAAAIADALQWALRASEESYNLQVDDYRHSLVSNLDVLQTLQTLQDARRDYIAAKYDARRSYWQLRAATGETL